MMKVDGMEHLFCSYQLNADRPSSCPDSGDVNRDARMSKVSCTSYAELAGICEIHQEPVRRTRQRRP